MGLPLEKIGTVYGPVETIVDPVGALAFAAATNDRNPAYEEGRYAPPVYGVVPGTFYAGMCGASDDLVPPDMVKYALHGEQDMYFHQPLVPGTRWSTTATYEAVLVGATGSRSVVRLESRDAATQNLVLTQYVTTFVRGMVDGASRGKSLPNHDISSEIRDRPMGQAKFHVDADQTLRYAEATDCQTPFHLDDAFARSVGLPGAIADGLCVMAMCGATLVERAGEGDPSSLRRLAVRFAGTVLPRDDIDVAFFDGGITPLGHRAVAFEARSADSLVMKNGLAEFGRPASSTD